MNKRNIIALLVVLVTFGGTYLFIYSQAESELKLAELKSDLDGMYRSLQTLNKLQVPSAKKRLSDITSAISLREEMLRNTAEHDHESAVRSAARLLEIVPHHNDGIRILKESGQIFYLLREARNIVNDVLGADAPTSASFTEVHFDEAAGKPSEDLVKYIQKGLTDLGHYYSEIDGVAGAGTASALELFATKEGLDNALSVNNETANMISAAIALQESKKEWRQKRFHKLDRARELASRAVDLDPNFDLASNFINDLDRAHGALTILIGSQVLEKGQAILSSAAKLHDTTLSILTAAVSYDIVSEMYAKLKPNLDDAGRVLSSMQEEIDESMQLISTYKGDQSRDYIDSIKEFVHVVRTGANALLVPTGSVKDYRDSGRETVREYERAVSRVKASLPDSEVISETVTGLVKLFAEYVIFADPETEQIIDQNIALITT